MRHIFFSILIISMIGVFYGCQKEDWEKEYDEQQKEYDAHRLYSDMFVTSTWISVTDKDSIIMELGYFGDTLYSSSIWIYHYNIVNSKPILTKNDYYPDGYVYGNQLTFSYSSQNKKVNYPFVLNNDKLTLSNFINNQNHTFYREYVDKEYIENTILLGKWTTTMNMENVVLVFENNRMKKYIYEKSSGEILKYTDYKYYLRKKIFTLQNQIRYEYKLWLYDNNDKIIEINEYNLSDNTLTIFESNVPVIYTKENL